MCVVLATFFVLQVNLTMDAHSILSDKFERSLIGEERRAKANNFLEKHRLVIGIPSVNRSVSYLVR
jgi:hypothetical protein